MIGRMADQYKNGAFVWYTGVVEDIDDKEHLNRVKVRCFGFYDESVEVKDLPWATVMMPTTTASLKENGGNHHLEVGSWVIGFFRDGPSAQDPIVMGSIATQTDRRRDIPPESSPDNKVYRSKAGHLIEIDNTDGAEEIRITHAKRVNGIKSYIHMREDGRIEIKSATKVRII